MNDLVLRAGVPDARAGGPVAEVTPERAGWGYSGLLVHEIAPGGRLDVELAADEAVVVPLRGSLRIDVTDPGGQRHDLRLAGRPGVFAGPADTAYLPVGSTVTLRPDGVDGADARVAVATARAGRVLPVQVLRARQVPVDLRGAGRASRQVHNYTIGSGVEVDRILVCEVLTPGGNWSSYPPHKHDAHSDTPGHEERELEEIYYFEVADGPAGPGLAYHRVYGTADRPIDVAAEVRTGDTVLVPHGYHGPSAAAPGYDLYYLNVMAGPADDGTWLSVDDPAHHWVRETWETEPVDPRLPLGPTTDLTEEST
ncbi:5-deoxy-glucuronate isomerase [Promicromonospora sp. NPDC057138]|uniref:5-deoxy-glucuronate isomerase n=1 Tax=Promicromonospora sp. NPDC057138 TaxID=3346031 RepID=UPI0036309EC1